jgi:hypothetical protein
VGGEQALKALRLASLIEQMALDGRVWDASEQDLLYSNPQDVVNYAVL